VETESWDNLGETRKNFALPREGGLLGIANLGKGGRGAGIITYKKKSDHLPDG